MINMCPLRVATFNIKVGVDSHPTTLASDLLALRLDLLALQEIGERWRMGVPISQTHYLAAAQQHPYLHFAPALTDRETGGQFGIAMTSKWPLKKMKQELLPQQEDEQRTLFITQIDPPHWSGSSVTILTAHLSVKEPERVEQAQHIARLAQEVQGPLLVIGDLNDRPQTPTLKVLYEAGLKDPWRALYPQEEGYTFSVKNPHRRIDYLLYRHLRCTDIQVMTQVKSSDHFPLLAEFTPCSNI